MQESVINPGIFRAYDIRGIVGKTLHTQDMQRIGFMFGRIVAKETGKTNPNIILTRDGRLSSPKLAEACCIGLTASGAQVLTTGVGPTPLCYFARTLFDADGAIMITGSHNPKDHNGLKLMLGSRPFYGENLQVLLQQIQQDSTLPTPTENTAKPIRILKDYCEHLARELEGIALAFPIIWDAGNGATSAIIHQLSQIIDAQHHVLLHCNIDGNFPNHHPDPSKPENLQDIIREIAKHPNSIGFAFDGDGDRMGVVDELGRPLNPDHLLMLLIREVLVDSPGGQIIVDVKTSDSVIADIKAHGGVPIMWQTGHALIKDKLIETKAPFAGEASGHLFFGDRYFGFDDGPYAAVRLIRLMVNKHARLCDLVDELPQLHTSPEWRIPCNDAQKFAIIDAISTQLHQEGLTPLTLDGVRVSDETGWWLLRASNTEACLVAKAEGHDAAGLNALQQRISHYLAPHQLALPL